MNKKLIAVAVASALGVPAVAWAQASTVQIYGRAYLQYGFIDQGAQTSAGAVPGGQLPDVDTFQGPGSSIGVKGEERLSSNLSAWYQCESTATINGTGAGGLCTRNTAIGLKGGWGSVFFGLWDTPFKRVQGVTRGVLEETGVLGSVFLMFGNSITADGRGTATATGAGSNNGGAWPRRQANSINYDSPNWNGFQLMGQMTTLGGAGGATGMSAGASGAKPRLYSLGAQYSNGPLYIGGAYEVHKNFWSSTNSNATPAVNTTIPAGTYNAQFGGTDHAWHIGANYTFPVGAGLKIGGIYSKQEWDTPGAVLGSGGTNVDRRAWQLHAHWMINTAHELKFGYTNASSLNGSGTTAANAAYVAGNTMSGTGITYNVLGSTGADLWQIQYLHNLSKRTQVGAGYSHLDNESNARFALGGAANPWAGESQDAFMLFIDHRF